MRQIILDTETTGLNAKLGDRIIEIGCVELASRRFTGNNLHLYVNPERSSEEGALAVHGISDEFLQDKPKFADIADDFLEYVRGAELIIHNADFDVEFLDMELAKLDRPALREHCAGVFDTLRFARELHPGKKNSLDSLCERYGIDNSHRTLHGGLLDATLLAEVYLAMTRGQDSLAIDLEAPVQSVSLQSENGVRPRLVVLMATDEELAAHQAMLEKIDRESKGRCVWSRLETGGEEALAA